MKSCTAGSTSREISRLASTASRMRVELISSSWGGSVSSTTLPVMQL